ncbi:hypothetical protein ACE01N_13530 [Saccharicrinis sp. FJH2]|uniref:hypothetical protein n=1 Tax=Saccharicrinis sp. FJH65 TaxID=3344659 RepID=UPI0035F2A91F
MKNRIKARFLFMLLLFTTGFCSQVFSVNISYEKDFEYPVDSLAKVRLNNQHGSVNITFADIDSIYINVNLSVNLDLNSDSSTFFSHINYAVSGSSQKVDIELIVDPDYASNYLYDSEINIKAPSYLLWNLTNKFGDVFLNGPLTIQNLTLDYGKLHGTDLLFQPQRISNLTFFQADVTLHYIANALIHCENSIVAVNRIDEAIIKSEFSTWTVQDGDNLNISTETDNFNINNAGDVKLNGMYSEFTINNVTRNLETVLNYGKFRLGDEKPGFQTINIDHSNVFTNLVFQRSVSFNLNADIKYCELVVDKNLSASVKTIEDGASRMINGVVGSNADTESAVTVIGRFENINLNLAGIK